MDIAAVQQIQTAVGIDQAADAVALALTGSGFVALPSDFKQHDLETFMPKRRRARGLMTTNHGADFAQYVKEHAEEGACVFVDQDEMAATAVLNLGKPEAPGHTDNRAKLVLKKSAAYAALKKASAGPVSQLAAAEFLEDWSDEAACFNSDGVIPLAKAVAAIRKLSIETMRKLESSEQSLSASRSAFESIQATSADPIPTTISFVCEPYHGLAGREFTLRLGVQTGGDKPAIVLRVIKQELHDEEMATEFAGRVATLLQGDIPVLLGAYRSQS
jgi:uncharacterized protein YfdQ (DUF2303 family)